MINTDTKADKVFLAVNAIILVFITFVTAYPIWYVLIASISNPDLLMAGKILLTPKQITFEGYKAIFDYQPIMIGYRNTIFYTTLGTMINLAVTLPAAYALSRKDFVGNKFFTIMFLITMFFGGGLMPTYLIVDKLHLVNTIWVLMFCSATSMTNIILCRTYFASSIAPEMQEAAQIDGCSNFRLFFRIILPLSKPIIAVMVLFFAIGHWNEYFTSMIYISNPDLKPLQLVMMELTKQTGKMEQLVQQGLADPTQYDKITKTRTLMQYALIITASLPVMCLYPLVQKYFVKGVMMGAIKS